MPARHGSRFALEAGFLILLAVLAGLADLRWQAIVLVMAIAWLLIALLEWAFWREAPHVPPVPRGYAEWAPPVAPPPPAPVTAPPAAPPLLPPREDATRIIEPGELEPAQLPAAAETEPEGEAEAPEPEPDPASEPEPAPTPEAQEPEPEPDAESSGEDDAPPRRPWWWRRREPEAEAEPARPRHVRVLPPGPEREEE